MWTLGKEWKNEADEKGVTEAQSFREQIIHKYEDDSDILHLKCLWDIHVPNSDRE